MTFFYDTFRTSFGDFSLAVDNTTALVATAFGDLSALRTRLPKCDLVDDAFGTRAARLQVQEFLSGKRTAFDLVLAPLGTAFQHRVWSALRAIPRGATRSYREIAEAIDAPGAARAVGRANATNPICLVVPCHRVIGTNGSLTGFAFGEPLKKRLLEFERTAGIPSCQTEAARGQLVGI